MLVKLTSAQTSRNSEEQLKDSGFHHILYVSSRNLWISFFLDCLRICYRFALLSMTILWSIFKSNISSHGHSIVVNTKKVSIDVLLSSTPRFRSNFPIFSVLPFKPTSICYFLLQHLFRLKKYSLRSCPFDRKQLISLSWPLTFSEGPAELFYSPSLNVNFYKVFSWWDLGYAFFGRNCDSLHANQKPQGTVFAPLLIMWSLNIYLGGGPQFSLS